MPRRSRPTPSILSLAALALAALLTLLVSSPAGAWGYGVNRVQSAAEDSHAQTGMGPGWVLLSYKANGPMVGYLFGEDFRFADGSIKPGPDHMDIRDTGDGSAGNPSIDRWPWGFAGGSFDGCAYAYGTSKFAIKRSGFMSGSCAGGPNVVGSSHGDGTPDQLRWWHSERVFCQENAVDHLCSPYGVWSTNKGGGLKVTHSTAACTVYGNIGAAAAYGSGAAVPRHVLGTVPAGAQIDVRYTTKDRQWVMAKWHGQRFAGGIAWAFIPRGCVA
ncbi:hypothetical protein RM572_16425 [Streptomyces sp. DSM 42041]|uniref:SH3 domain-containing protein n=1 Tax=Streptomyces hazeniae TaxID=3075538 RepID=A0ABU2NTM0_9ACTN|nr:hypothetical protein [Streptomyces sp. DSM 42041]MDT0380341.1 hypothetical protein [Streptomyces sp. DSM 42041]